MPYTLAAKIVAHQALLDRLSSGSGVAAIALYAGGTLLVSLPLDHAASSVNVTTGVLELEPGDPAAAVASGTGTSATLVARDGVVLHDVIPVEAGTSPVAGKIVFSSLNIITGGVVALVSATIG
jgi:hypothetical protein